MALNYIGNRGGSRHICWSGIAVFAAVCSFPALGPHLFYKLVMPEAVAAATISTVMGLFVGVGVFVISLARAFQMPLEKLPSSPAA